MLITSTLGQVILMILPVVVFIYHVLIVRGVEYSFYKKMRVELDHQRKLAGEVSKLSMELNAKRKLIAHFGYTLHHIGHDLSESNWSEGKFTADRKLAGELVTNIGLKIQSMHGRGNPHHQLMKKELESLDEMGLVSVAGYLMSNWDYEKIPAIVELRKGVTKSGSN